MRIEDFEGTHEVGAEHIETILARRHASGMNASWLSHDGDEYPVIAILVNGDLANIEYFPKEGHPGFQSVGSEPGLSVGEHTKFFVRLWKGMPSDEVSIPNRFVIPFSTALKVAKEFSRSKNLPSSIQWFEL